MGWIRRLVRRYTNPIHPEIARKKSNFYSGLYFFAAWNFMSYGIYLLIKENTSAEKEESPSKFYAKLLNTEDVKVYRFHGFQQVDEYLIKGTQSPQTGRTKEDRVKAEAENKMREKEKIREIYEKHGKKSMDEDLNILVEETDSF